MTKFATFTRFAKPSYARYEGMDEATITALLTDLGATNIAFVSEEVYQALQPVHVD